MCGIAGYYGVFPIKDQQIQRCLKLMHRRGPDHANFFQHTNAKGRYVYLLSSRLSILDLQDRSDQPFQLGSKVLVYNGELYNYLELKQKLIAQNKKFLTKSDTEVLLQILAVFGWIVRSLCDPCTHLQWRTVLLLLAHAGGVAGGCDRNDCEWQDK